MKDLKKQLFGNTEYWRGGVIGTAAAFFIAAAFSSNPADFIRFGALTIVFGVLALVFNLRRRGK
jgi:hypothetical protein